MYFFGRKRSLRLCHSKFIYCKTHLSIETLSHLVSITNMNEMIKITADVYDAVYQRKDYRAESAKICELVERFGAVNRNRNRTKRLLDVACGTGRHIECLKQNFDTYGLDQDIEFLESARNRNPDVLFCCADMKNFSLGISFDVIICFGSALVCVESLESLQLAVACFSKHLAPGGLLIIEPWLSESEIVNGQIDVRHEKTDKFSVTRMYSVQKTGRVAEVQFHYLVGNTATAEISYVREIRRLAMFTKDDYRQCFNDCRLQCFVEPIGLTYQRGLIVGIK